MINDKLNEIEKDLKEVKKLVENNDYIKTVEDHCNKFNYREEKIKELQDRIDKAKKYIKEHSTAIDYKTMKADYNLNMNDLLDILKGE